MIHAYDKSYLEKARINLGRMIDYAVYDLKYTLEDFWNIFIISNVANRFEKGDIEILAGRSGIELALMTIDVNSYYTMPFFNKNRSREYWLGYSLAYFQWYTRLSFKQINQFISINEILSFYNPYHEMDIRHFVNKLLEIYKKRKKETNLKLLRIKADLTQKELSIKTGIPIRTIQQYEQKQKDINKARSEYIITLSSVLNVDPSLLLEINIQQHIRIDEKIYYSIEMRSNKEVMDYNRVLSI